MEVIISIQLLNLATMNGTKNSFGWGLFIFWRSLSEWFCHLRINNGRIIKVKCWINPLIFTWIQISVISWNKTALYGSVLHVFRAELKCFLNVFACIKRIRN